MGVLLMGKKITANFRTAGFVAINNGTIKGSVSDVKLKSKQQASGFVFDNSGEISSSLSLRQPKEGINTAGFCHRNRGSLNKSAWIRPMTEKEAKAENAANASSAKKHKHSDADLCCAEKLSDSEVLDRFGLSGEWSSPEGLHPDIDNNRIEAELGTEVIDISSADELLEIIDSINSGDEAAAKAHYRLTKNINLGGKRIDPIGIDEDSPFCGKLDGNSKTVSNFRIAAKDRQYAGFFGYVKNAEVSNLAVDCIVNGKGGNVVGGMVGFNDGGTFSNCHVLVSLTVSSCTGGFVGKNTGKIINCCVIGSAAAAIPIIPILSLAGVGILLIAVLLLVLALMRANQPVYTPSEKIDVNQVPADDGIVVDPPPPGSNRISFNVLREISISYESKVGRMDYINPKRATQDVVISLVVSDAELINKGYDLADIGVRSAEEQNASGYDPSAAYTLLYQSDRLQIGYKLEACKIKSLPNGEHLPIGDYEMILIIDAYDPVTFEKAAVNAKAPITVHIVD